MTQLKIYQNLKALLMIVSVSIKWTGLLSDVLNCLELKKDKEVDLITLL